MNIPLIVLLVINYWYSIDFTCLYFSYIKNRMKNIGTSSKSFIEGAVSLTSTKDLQNILVRENNIYPLNYQPKFHNIQRGTRCLGSIIITINIGKYFVLRKKIVSAGRFLIIWTLGLCRAIFDLPMK